MICATTNLHQDDAPVPNAGCWLYVYGTNGSHEVFAFPVLARVTIF
jgi:hypothetical protein